VALLTLGEAPKSHAGVKIRFSHHFIRTGRLAHALGLILTTAEQARTQSDYDATSSFDTNAVADLVADVERFLQALAPLLPPAS
jgi:hypothetical protein